MLGCISRSKFVGQAAHTTPTPVQDKRGISSLFEHPDSRCARKLPLAYTLRKEVSTCLRSVCPDLPFHFKVIEINSELRSAGFLMGPFSRRLLRESPLNKEGKKTEGQRGCPVSQRGQMPTRQSPRPKGLCPFEKGESLIFMLDGATQEHG